MAAFKPQFFIGENNPATMLALLVALVEVNLDYLRRHPETPSLYGSGVRYCEERPGKEHWCQIGECLKRGKVDCEDLAAWRVAELRARGIVAHIHLDAFPIGNGAHLYHIRVRHVDGSLEDPSLQLGMNAHSHCDV